MLALARGKHIGGVEQQLLAFRQALANIEARDETVQIGISRTGRCGEQPSGETCRCQIKHAGEDMAPGDCQSRFALE